MIMRELPLPVVIVTVNWRGNQTGMTVNTFNSLSLRPPLILFSADRSKGNHLPFIEADSFVVNFVEDEKLSDRFANVPPEDRFTGLKFHRGVTGAPILEDAYAYIEAKKSKVIDEGDHSILIGEVLEGKIVRDGRPLLYYRRRYWRLNEFA
ncbi:flavin reductase [Sulfodiicoccus acidiphilus]|uniref:Flavin reductase n=2 Tax=Sulfodiicoccus acidiphilus TaxID=1670455 RepID=A0A348B2M8_9CREN|nr:flavin reductase [Sulfodiicoccus acidiphilus]GGT97186.1 flavin reductase [Sulfodiicoccus acidiphilus]